MNNDYKNLAKQCTNLTFLEESITIKELLENKNGIFLMLIFPYFTLYCKSLLDYLEFDGDEDTEWVKNTRNSMEVFKERYEKSKGTILDEDEIQDKVFSEGLFEFIKNNKFYYNMGLYFTSEHKLIGNTQLIDIEMGFSEMSIGEKSLFAFKRAKFIASIVEPVYREAIKRFELNKIIDIKNKPKLFCIDIHSDKTIIFDNGLEKDISIFLIHILSRLNFIKYYIEFLFYQKDSWLLRVQYISIHYAFLAIKRMTAANNDNKKLDELRIIVAQNENLICSQYRNCMMHYNYMDKGTFTVSNESFDSTQPFFGLVNECFGMKYDQYYKELLNLRDKIENAITKLFDFESLALEDD